MTRDQLEHAIRAACDVYTRLLRHALTIEAVSLPEGWRGRAIPVPNANTRGNTGWCVEGHDLAASKLVAFREKDREFVRILLVSRMLDAGTLEDRIRALPEEVGFRERMVRWVDQTVRSAGSQ